MTVPSYDQFIEPLLRYLADHPDGVRTVEAHEAVARALGLSDEQRAERVPSGVQPLYKNRNGWAHDRLKRAGLSTSPRQGFWRLTPEGHQYLQAHPHLSDDDVEQLTIVDPNHRLRPRKDTGPRPAEPGASQVDGATVTIKESPEDRIDAAVDELRDRVARDLLENIGRSPPDFFEQLVLDLLHAMGYGTSRSDLKRVGGSGDQGIDGIISLDRLGLEKVYVQAKRWKNTVGSPEIQGFMGALQLQSASKGVFITTSTFSPSAKDAATRARGTIVLVDGGQLAALMMDHGVGVTHKALRIPKIDGDYFEDV